MLIIFTGGIGENSAEIRALICANLSWLGIELDAPLNKAFSPGREGVISQDAARLKVFVIPTNEELLIARDTARLINANSSA